MNRLPHLFIILKPEFQGEGISLLPWSFNSLKMPLTQVVTMGTYSQLEKMEPPTISALSSSWCIFVFKIYFGTVQTQTTSRIHLSDFLKIKGVILAEKKTCSWNVKHLLQKQRKNTHGFWRSFNPKKKQQHFLFKKKTMFHSRASTPTSKNHPTPSAGCFPLSKLEGNHPPLGSTFPNLLSSRNSVLLTY